MRVNGFQRRRFLGAGSAGLLVAAAGCAVVGRSARAQVVVVGGGWGGLGAVRGLIDRNVEVTLVEPNEAFFSSPMSALYIAGVEPASYLRRSYERIDALGVRRVRERVIEIDRAKSEVVTANRRIGYDFLVLSPGIEYMEEAVPGYAEARAQLPVGFRAGEHSAVRELVEQFLSRGGEFVISVPRPPFRCPPAPYERACLIAEQMRKRGTKGKIILIDANAAPVPTPIATPVLNAMALYGKEIEYWPNAELRSVDIGRRSLQTGIGEIRFQFANIVLPQRAPGLIRQAGLGERWASVALPSFRSTADPKIYVIGDAHGSPLPKSGHLAFGAGKQVGARIIDLVAGKPMAAPGGAATLPSAICWAKVTEKEAINITVTASVAPGEAPKIDFSVDPAHNAKSGAAAREWASGIWNAMLG